MTDLEKLEQQSRSEILASGWVVSDSLRTDSVTINENGSVTFRFVAEDEKTD